MNNSGLSIRVDEIIISDDGSTDDTIKIIDDISCSCSNEIRIVVLINEKRHGYCGNFENAIANAKGDIIFLADQDDLWMPDKVEKVLQVFESHSDCNMVMTNGNIIDKNDIIIKNELTASFRVENHLMHLDGIQWLEYSVSRCLCNGMVVAISRTLLSEAFPFPPLSGLHDHWLEFISILTHGCYYLNEPLVSYRLHGDNTAGNKVYKGTIQNRLLKIKKRIRSNNKTGYDIQVLSNAFLMKLCRFNLEESAAYKIAQSQNYIGSKLVDAYESFRLVGTLKILILFCTNVRYRRSGTNEFLYDLVRTLIK